MKLKMLGSGGWEGVPTPFCSCKICKLAQKNPKSKENRTRPEMLVETGDGKFLIEISPDIRTQTSRFALPTITDFLISHWHFDHMYGLLELHAWSQHTMKGKIRIFCSQKTKEWLDKNFAHIPKEVIVLQPYRQFELHGVKITPLPVYHMEWQDKNIPEDQLSNTLGYLLEHDEKKIVYLPDYYKVPRKTLEAAKNADVAILDGTYLFEESFPDKPEQNGEKADPDHLHGNKIIEFAKSLNAKKAIFHSITHLPEKTHEEMQKDLPAGMFISYDGMELE